MKKILFILLMIFPLFVSGQLYYTRGGSGVSIHDTTYIPCDTLYVPCDTVFTELWTPPSVWKDSLGVAIDITRGGDLGLDTINLLIDTRVGNGLAAFAVTCVGGYKVKWSNNESWLNVASTVTTERKYDTTQCTRFIVISITKQGANGITAFAIKRPTESTMLTTAILWVAANYVGASPIFYYAGGADWVKCPKIESIWLKSVTSIAVSSFSYCSSLRDVTIPASAVTIGGYAFSNCSSLSIISLPSTVSTIGNGAFQYCSMLRYVFLPSGISSFGTSVFAGCPSLMSVIYPTNLTVFSSSTFLSDYSLQVMVVPEGVVTLGQSAFQDCWALRVVNLPSSLQTIGTAAFKNCYGLTCLWIPSGVTSIGDNALSYCSSLKSIILPSGITTIGASVFYYNASIQELILPHSTTTIGTSAFAYCYSLPKITIPPHVTAISASAFDNCLSLDSITFETTNCTLGAALFYNCSSLKYVKIPSGATAIGLNFFSGCVSLDKVYIPNTVLSIGNYAFNFCYSLRNVTIPSTVTSIGTNVFSMATGLKTATYTGTITTAADGTGMFYNVEHLDTINWPGYKCTNFGISSYSTYPTYFGTHGNLANDSIPVRFNFAGSFQQAAATVGLFDLSYNRLDTATIVHIFKNLPHVTTPGTNNKTINVKGNVSGGINASTLTTAQTDWATNNHWLVVKL
jgi:hypothetical protein